MPLSRRFGFVLLLFLSTYSPSRAELREIVIHRREPFAEGQSFGAAGPYEKLVGLARFAVDPGKEQNRGIIDLERAPRNADGKVEFEADIYILAPRDLTKGNGAILYDVNNRGGKLALGMFNEAPGSNDPSRPADAGNGYLFRRGYTVVWCGWIGELLPGGNKLLLKAPIAKDGGKPIRGLVRYETATDVYDKKVETLPLSRRDGHGSYPPTARGEAEGVLTWRMRETDPRVVIPRSQWSLERQPVPSVEQGVAGTLGQVRLRVAGGFRPGYLYELICEAEGPIVQGLGFAATRDLISFLKYNTTAANPLRTDAGKSPITRAHGFGVSQSGRFLRMFVYQGFNRDEADRKVFDGLMPHVAGGGLGFFNHRFAQPTRHNGQHEEHLYPADIFPFTYGDSVDPFSKQTDGILRRTRRQGEKYLPRIMHTQSAAEYWHRSGSLVHTDPLGKTDADIPDEVRIYAFGGTQHGPAGRPERGIADNLSNPGNYKPLLRGLLDALDAWVRDGTPPPASVYPRIKDNTLVAWDQRSTGFPALPGLRYPEVIQRPQALDLGPEFATNGVISVEPPHILGNYVVLVPRCHNTDGNELGTLLPPEVAVSKATYTGWNLRRREVGAEGMLASLLGSYIPLPRTREEREKTGDPRPSFEERYQDEANYQRLYVAECRRLAEQRYLTQEDADRLIRVAQESPRRP